MLSKEFTESPQLSKIKHIWFGILLAIAYSLSHMCECEVKGRLCLINLYVVCMFCDLGDYSLCFLVGE